MTTILREREANNRKAVGEAYQTICREFFAKRINRRGREAILLSLVADMTGEKNGDLTREEAERIKQAIARVMDRPGDFY
jgi:hypothetical protein